MTPRDDLASALKAWRKKAGFTQEKAAELLGVDPSQLSRWENGRQLPKQARSKEIARIYGIDRAVVSDTICAATEDELVDANRALAVVAGLSERVEMMQSAMAEILRRLPER